MAYRLYTAGPKGGDELLSLISKPAHPEQIAPRASNAAQRAEEAACAPPLVVRATNAAHVGAPATPLGSNGMMKKRLSKGLESNTKLPTGASQKKRLETLDPKASIIKAMMQQASRQAEQQRQQYQQMQQAQQQGMPLVGGAPGGFTSAGANLIPASGPSQSSGPVRSSSISQSMSPATPASNGVQSPAKPAPSFVASGQGSPAPPAHQLIPGTPTQVAGAPVSGQFSRQQHQARQQLQATQQMQMMQRQHQLAQARQQQHQQQLQQQELPQQVQQQQHAQSASSALLQPSSQGPSAATGLTSPNSTAPNGFTQQQLFYYPQTNNPANQLNLQQQARAQVAMQNLRAQGGLNQATLGAIMQGNSSVNQAHLQAYIAQQHQHQQQSQQGHLSMQQHMLNQQKLKSAASGALAGSIASTNGIPMPQSIPGSSPQMSANMSTPSSGALGDLGASGSSLSSAQLQQFQIQQQIQKQLTARQLQQSLTSTHHQPTQPMFKTTSGAPSPLPASPAIGSKQNSPSMPSSSADAHSSDKENGPTSGILQDHPAMSPHLPSTKSAA
ncbi:hypothetical protein HKX48_006465 [Thoreauomyces humboldtii]|nr:hypothetical protein HKX48_006465 [Thoreauomyces humboldtii]